VSIIEAYAAPYMNLLLRCTGVLS